MSWIRARLVPEARQFWRLWTIRLNAIGLALLSWAWFDPVSVLAVWNMMPVPVRNAVPPSALLLIGGVLFMLSMIARLVRQPKIEQS